MNKDDVPMLGRSKKCDPGVKATPIAPSEGMEMPQARNPADAPATKGDIDRVLEAIESLKKAVQDKA